MIRRLFPLLLALAACHDQAAGGGAAARDQIKAVGSSTVYPFTTLVAEQYLAGAPQARPPVIESTGTGAGLKLFCGGIGAAWPDIADASRRMRRSEFDRCTANGVDGILEVPIGIDGVAIARARSGPALALSPAILYRALAAAPGGRANAARTWQDVDPALPASRIQVYGPPATSGTRDALAELILAAGCEQVDPATRALRLRDEAAFAARCTRLREDGAYVDAGENDNLIVQKLQVNPDALGVFGYSYLEENMGVVEGVPLAGIAPTAAAISDGSYPGARPLYLYVKRQHLAAIPGLRRFLALYVRLLGSEGPLARRGLIPTTAPVQAGARAIVRDELTLDRDALS